MAPKSTFILKDSPSEVIKSAKVEPKGRTYSTKCSKQPGGIKIDDLLLGMKLASLAITDDKPNTLRKVSTANPWQKEALKMITGSKKEAFQPLSTILKKHFDLTLDAHIDVRGIKHGRPLDTQGYIAHNDDIIVLSYRCTTSVLDWITNLSTTSSEWEPDIDFQLGHAGYCSCLMGHDMSLCGTFGDEGDGSDGEGQVNQKPRVHTGFYNNFIHTAPLSLKHIVPLLQEDQKPRKLYVVGHSLGAGIATLAASYFLLNFEWELLPHQLVSVTAGSPRAVKQSMRDVVNRRLLDLEPMNKVCFCRIVLNEDVVTKVPPSFLGFVHLDNLVYITEEGEVLIRPKESSTFHIDENQLEEICKQGGQNGGGPYAGLMSEEKKLDDDSTASSSSNSQTEPSTLSSSQQQSQRQNDKYDKMIKLVPGALKDHMPDFYLRPLVRLFEREKNGYVIAK